MCEFWFDYVKPKCGEKTRLFMDTDRFIVFIKTEEISGDIAKDVKTRSDTSSYELDRQLKEKIKKK